MIGFKEFLTEASTGKDKWEKYFGSDDVETIMKSDVVASDAFGKPTKKMLKKGDPITVLAGEYSPKPLIRVGKATYSVSLAAIEKPFKKEQSIRTSLKPDQLGLNGPIFLNKFDARIKKLIAGHKELSEPQIEYLKTLVDLAKKPGNAKAEKKARELYDAHIKNDSALKSTINNDFMEVLGPFFVADQMPEYSAGGAKFPEAGNEPLYDFTMKAKPGPAEPVDMFSSKKSGGATNTLKVTEIVKAASKKPAMKRKYARELELMEIILNNPVKKAPHEINLWLKKNFPKYKLAPEPTDNAGIARLEAAVAKFINDSSGMDFTPLVKNAIPDLWYVRARLNNDGTLKVEPIKAGREIEEVKLRSKSSPNHLSDKLGFAV